MKIKIKWIIIGVVVILIAGYFMSGSLFKDPLAAYVTEKVSAGEVVQSISETGSVKATESASLSFKSTGRIARINVSVGDNVRKGDILAELDSGQSFAQLQSAKASLEEARQEYDKLLNGLTLGDIKTYQNAVDSAQNDLQSAYDSAKNTLNDAYTKIYNSLTTVVSMQAVYFIGADQAQLKVSDSVNDINQNMQRFVGSTQDAIDVGLLNMASALDRVYNDLQSIREQCDQGVYYARVSTADKASLDTQKGYINTASASITSAKESISAYKVALQKAKDNLALKTAGPRQEDINIYRSQMQQAEANVNLYQSQLGDIYLTSPMNAQIIEIDAKRGEIVSFSNSIINLLSLDPFEIKVNIYEQDIVNVKQDDEVKIDLVAFPRQTFLGRVISIDPAEKIVDNVVYYEVTIDFGQQPELIRSGMTADIVIETNKKDNVLRVSKNAVENLDGKDIVQVAVNKKIETREIVLGLEGDDYYEVVLGLSAGELIVTGKK